MEEHKGSSEPTQRKALGTHVGLLMVIMLVLTVIAVWRPFDKRGPEPLDKRLRGDADEAVAALAEKLAPLDPSARLRLLLQYVGDSNPYLRYASVDALGQLKSRDVADTIETAFQDSASIVRQRALEVLHETNPERGYDLLLKGLRDEDDWIRQAAALQLSVFFRKPGRDGRRAYPSLIAAMEQPDEAVRRTAVHIMVRLTGQPWKMRAGMTDAERMAVIKKWQAWWHAQRTPSAPLPEPVRPTRRDPAPAFRIRDLDGVTHTRENLRGKIALVHFYATWCAPCQEEMRQLGKLSERYGPQGVQIIGVALAPNDADTVRQWCSKRGIRFPQALAAHDVLEVFGHVHEVPISVLIDRDGMIRYRWDGERAASTFESAFTRLLSGG
jgi:cytochrome c biogenesis protein CcmG/thiol:disulfide interchange protein DsbE